MTLCGILLYIWTDVRPIDEKGVHEHSGVRNIVHLS